jgi:hypothetical protein
MKKVMSAVIIASGLLSAGVNAATAHLAMSEQMQAQKIQLRPQAFNFFSDRYRQLQAMKKTQPSIKAQLDSQTQLLRYQQFNPVSDAYVQVQARKS